MTILIRSGRVVNPATGMDETADVLVENGIVAKNAGPRPFNQISKEQFEIIYRLGMEV